jgi:hypothetical protein
MWHKTVVISDMINQLNENSCFHSVPRTTSENKILKKSVSAQQA